MVFVIRTHRVTTLFAKICQPLAYRFCTKSRATGSRCFISDSRRKFDAIINYSFDLEAPASSDLLCRPNEFGARWCFDFNISPWWFILRDRLILRYGIRAFLLRSDVIKIYEPFAPSLFSFFFFTFSFFVSFWLDLWLIAATVDWKADKFDVPLLRRFRIFIEGLN